MRRGIDRVACLDGLRGIAALWVLVGHGMLLTGFYVPIFVAADLGVDLFILLSGFLMVFQYQLRQEWGKLGFAENVGRLLDPPLLQAVAALFPAPCRQPRDRPPASTPTGCSLITSSMSCRNFLNVTRTEAP
ncbi:MAG: acyltransferase family protein [Verrucomicrobiota bacterium]